MSTCNNCIHSPVCTPYNTPNDNYPNIGDCPHFKNKADYVLVKHGNWVKDRNKRTCSICGFLYLENGKTTFNFCPNCGANMKGGVE